ncbi:hypothetical protein CISIN_1g031347mg [Citrus sinensis]|uniref:Threonylcarbamoyl-AMP synthase n=1 Tax=Citrus sinensis TaxID=2711 RepID=A0A067FKF1_CITSI|nr:hypothetical protein CISIN_1g031347mg [Citrus sinensis]
MAGAKLCGGDTAFLLRSHSHSHSHFLEAATRRAAPFPGRVSSVSPNPKPSRYRILAMTVKRSPKRLKYSAPQFTKEGGLMYVEADPSGADSWKLEPVVELLKEGAVGVIPTDTLYAIVCDLKSHSAIERLRRIKNVEPSKVRKIASHIFSIFIIWRLMQKA